MGDIYSRSAALHSLLFLHDSSCAALTQNILSPTTSGLLSVVMDLRNASLLHVSGSFSTVHWIIVAVAAALHRICGNRFKTVERLVACSRVWLHACRSLLLV